MTNKEYARSIIITKIFQLQEEMLTSDKTEEIIEAEINILTDLLNELDDPIPFQE